MSTAYVSSRPLGLVDDLINNAVKYGPADRPIDVSVEGNADAVRVRILDRGPGIPDGEHETIFQLFHRSAATAKVKGIGVGLTVCRRLVEAHRGAIAARERPGGGSAFEFTLPVIEDR